MVVMLEGQAAPQISFRRLPGLALALCMCLLWGHWLCDQFSSTDAASTLELRERAICFFRFEEIPDFWSYSYSFVQSLTWDYLYKHCLASISLPRSHYSSGLQRGAVLPLGGYLAISGCIFFVIAGEGCCY